MSFATLWQRYFSPFDQFVIHDKSIPITVTFKCFFKMTISATETILTYAQQLTRMV